MTFLFDDKLTVHWLPDVESQPDQLSNLDVIAAVAVSVNVVPVLYFPTPVVPLQEIAEPSDIATEPVPVPDFATVSRDI
ncbi:hypothetical protein MBAV_000762 [Candidatus Magnetobacterium bavaricum]|uniref:Uncharacterized protein n=1 Tax=Candidatus Magnetobacterium bavaricum TaxID=29290 RepID=A0A0F3GYX8_9BACT|nr:hypothetical protein MBAV_000762 [Candidatus Magnetobacterium bavaricum]